MRGDIKAITLDAQLCNDVIEHMNQDHRESCLTIVRAFTEFTSATEATMTGMDAHGLEFSLLDHNRQAAFARVLFERPVSQPEQIRGFIVALARKARETVTNN